MPSAADEVLLKFLRDPERGRRNLAGLAHHLGEEHWPQLCALLRRFLPHCPDADMALNHLERLASRPGMQERWAHLLEGRGKGLEILVQLLGVSQFFADTLARYPEWLEAIRHPPRSVPTTAELLAELQSEIRLAPDDVSVLQALRRFRHRHLLRIGINDIIRQRSLEEITRELSRVAEALIAAALQHAYRTITARFGVPTAPDGSPARLAVLALGKLGGEELNYSSDIDLIVVYDHEGTTSGRRPGITNSECFSRIVAELVRLVSSHTEEGVAYRVDLRLRPEGQRGPLARSLRSTLHYYDTMGRTWERQALIKLRPVAGDAALGREVQAALEPFVYRQYLSFAEINEVKALKRRMEERAARRRGEGDFPRDIKHGPGGIRDIEYTVQFLQLLNGGDLPAVRQRNTLLALEALEIAGCLTPQETYLLADAYRFLRTTEHRLQLLCDLQTHTLPADTERLRQLALRLGYAASPHRSLGSLTLSGSRTLSPTEAGHAPQRRSPLDEEPPLPSLNTSALLVDPLDRFLKDLQDKTSLTRTILNHLLHQTFADAGDKAEPESDLILDPEPEVEMIQAVLSRYRFRDIPRAYLNLTQLARESVPFLSSRRCRHFLASIAPRLLAAVADTPDPDDALTQLERVSASLGAKAVLWELFSQHPACLQLYVELCASSPFLSGLLINNPGMIDELLDSLVLNQPRTAAELRAELAELCRGADDPEPILHSFQDKELLRIGVSDLLGRSTIRQTTAALSDLAETILLQIIDLVEPQMQRRWGIPLHPDRGAAEPCAYVLLGLGKLGGREISYHSDLDLLLLYEAEGQTTEGQANSVYFTELVRAIIRRASQMGPWGRLYAVDMRLRPTGKSGALVLPLSEFRRYFAQSDCQDWERQALTRARVLRGPPPLCQAMHALLREALFARPWTAESLDAWEAMRRKLEINGSPRNLKRAPGGLADVEFLVQLLQMKHGAQYPSILQPNVWDALDALEEQRLMAEGELAVLRAGYSFLRLVEARLRIVTDRPLNELPEDPAELTRLARRLGYPRLESFWDDWRRHTTAIRRCYQTLLWRERRPRSGPPL
ncbi:bifunctional [glutamate--ammonia ligase]-adenylyl-L-tyrosine phosphorylase/[glutamate--ammonia-ligase] adenylyltransferase [Thermogemmata fonticola]|uniref:Bifunctional [glutamate--ammonia ligase]-adenylyl-L-tyrosine phosphorylase/[glutamate--ammonia-ligase] adenylyltransferase n=1 Tax=Thermogemmata fonticola TaxID=2755323 RepID=A0A7V8VBZ6_9BACT|nr:bifunctional [glutamate--ammonia ligase]-adenylyl-L-tyrosine phosphorylase/[glutamate--ammonia-ligase] adenylyltransferase [Thermogemmata fonticola]MBA2225229.1 bifunctional [glutamate--ammonia ligase]-adenylyl-L-tyrosine phosphorylase/[glutamate--ammonia-ligase] adenylyltransferase [Thermogemmata fonticola]